MSSGEWDSVGPRPVVPGTAGPDSHTSPRTIKQSKGQNAVDLPDIRRHCHVNDRRSGLALRRPPPDLSTTPKIERQCRSRSPSCLSFLCRKRLEHYKNIRPRVKPSHDAGITGSRAGAPACARAAFVNQRCSSVRITTSAPSTVIIFPCRRALEALSARDSHAAPVDRRSRTGRSYKTCRSRPYAGRRSRCQCTRDCSRRGHAA